jgi:DegV family protein with EDD domain
MNSYRIGMDASADLDVSFFRENGILFLPMQYSLGTEMKDATGIEGDEELRIFYDGQRKGDLTHTTQITPYAYETLFRSYLEQGTSVLYLSLSSGLSNTYQSSLLGAKNLEEEFGPKGLKVLSVDTLGATGGIGVLIHRAVRNQKAGMTIEENAADLTEASHHLYHYFMVEDLLYLRRGGRVSTATALVGTALSIKPVLEIDPNGKLVALMNKHGKRAALEAVFSLFDQKYDPSGKEPIYLTHCDDVEKSEYLKKKILEKYPQADVRIREMNPIIGAHTGPGAQTLCFLGR